MNNLNLKLWAIALAGLTMFASCDDKEKGNGGNEPSGTALSGILTEDMKLSANTNYDLDGVLRVPAGLTLTIEEGVKITALSSDDIVDYILVEQGGKIMAEGTANAPIVMTAEDAETGAWGGLHICGKAPINKTSGTSEIGGASYGGDEPADNSGVLKYVRLEYTGYAFDEESESNGLTLYGVGNKTVIEYVQSFMGADDGFEWFGGTVKCNYLVSTGSGDDSFDWTQGWVGGGNYWLAQQIGGDSHGDALIEADNNGDDNVAQPVSNPTINYLTLIGNNTEGEKGIRLREGTFATISNALVLGKEKSVVVETPQTAGHVADGKLTNIICSGVYSSKESAYTSDDFVAAGNKISQIISLNGYVGQVNGAGAVPEGDDWTAGWTKSVDFVEPTTIGGTLSTDLTLKANSTNHLNGVLRVPADLTLTIEAGAKIIAMSDDDIVDYILVEQGGKIMAEGTKTAPIVMTSVDEEAGAWGGLHICGKAPVNKTNPTSEIGDASYGGSDLADNSGVLKYIRLEYTGFAFNEESESNGLTLYGVGNGTEIDYVQAYMGADDGFEWFGGSVKCNHLISTGSGDDSFDWTQGWVGGGNNWVAQQIAGADHGDALIEADNNGSDNVATPVSNPTLNCLTLVGPNTEGNKGIRLREGTHASISNVIVIGKENSMVIETPQTAAWLAEGAKLNNIICSGAFSTKETAYTETMFTEAGNKLSQDVSAINGFVGKIGEAGAVAADDNWTAGWSRAL